MRPLFRFPIVRSDAAVCQFGVMFVPDKAAAMRESFRVLRNGGVFLFNVWDSFKANPFAQIAHTTICSFFDHDPPGFYKIPFGFHDSTVIRGMLQDAGFDKIESFSEMKPCRSDSARGFATGLVRGNPVAAEATERGVDPEDLIEAVAKQIGKALGSAPVESTMRVIVWQATKF